MVILKNSFAETQLIVKAMHLISGLVVFNHFIGAVAETTHCHWHCMKVPGLKLVRRLSQNSVFTQQGMGIQLSSFTQQGMGIQLSSFTQQGMGIQLSSFTQ